MIWAVILHGSDTHVIMDMQQTRPPPSTCLKFPTSVIIREMPKAAVGTSTATIRICVLAYTITSERVSVCRFSPSGSFALSATKLAANSTPVAAASNPDTIHFTSRSTQNRSVLAITALTLLVRALADRQTDQPAMNKWDAQSSPSSTLLPVGCWNHASEEDNPSKMAAVNCTAVVRNRNHMPLWADPLASDSQICSSLIASPGLIRCKSGGCSHVRSVFITSRDRMCPTRRKSSGNGAK
uniref:Uncharacterized protein n=1 Tax=Haptolina brevifila TaxID=156173 RepID=A0A7S2N5K1_9EUKA|mmetsp:Transcript_6719/g.13879  ORF Transcript_6719/g.13879 Transcript_6719/m.13879 type:complete len:240 (+) Transcript_6719:302-1021(+)